jgi:adenylate cyclase
MKSPNNTEIERKFLIKYTPDLPDNGVTMKQGYLSVGEATTRVRTGNDKAWITIKGKTKGLSRPEYEYEIPHSDACEMLALFCPETVEKTRYLILHEGHTWEVDVFSGRHKGLIIAELELDDEDEEFSTPDWIGEEVSNDYHYRNSYLAQASWPFA